MTKFFKIERPNKEPVVIFSKNSWSGLVGLIEHIPDPDAYIVPMSWWKFIMYIIKR